MPSPHRELYVEDLRRGLSAVVLADRLDDVSRRELLAHALGHHFLHVGDRLSGRSRALWSGRHEREADDFAAVLLVPADVLASLCTVPDPLPLAELATDLGVSEQLLSRRAALLERTLPLTC